MSNGDRVRRSHLVFHLSARTSVSTAVWSVTRVNGGFHGPNDQPILALDASPKRLSVLDGKVAGGKQPFIWSRLKENPGT
jgi:hypothetical protein